MKPQGTAVLLLTSIPQPLPAQSGEGNHRAARWQLLLLQSSSPLPESKGHLSTGNFMKGEQCSSISSLSFFHFHLSLFSLWATFCPGAKGALAVSFPAVLRASYPSFHPQGSAAFQPRWLQGKAMQEDLVLHIHPEVIKFSGSGVDPAEVWAETLMACSSRGADTEFLI